MDGEVVEDSSGHTTGHMSGRVQVIARVSGRRIFTVDQKLAILRDAFGPDAGQRHGDALQLHVAVATADADP